MRCIRVVGTLLVPGLALLLADAIAADAPATAAVPPPGIAGQIAAAVAGGARQVRLRPGVYRVAPETPKQAHVLLHGLRDLDIDARGVTLICTNLSPALSILNCQDLSLRGLTIDYDPLPTTQGTIVGFAPDRTWTDVRIHQGYPAPTINAASWPSGQGFLWTYDKDSRLHKPGTTNRFVRDIVALGDGVYRLDHDKAEHRDQAALGDFIRIPQKYEVASGINIHGCERLAVEDLILQAAPTHFAVAARYCHELAFRRVRLIPGPPPAGATEPRLSVSVGDGINCAGITGGLVIEDCELDSTGDDGIAVYAEPGLVLQTDGDRRLTLSFQSGGHPPLAPGSRLRLFSESAGTMSEATVVSSAPSALSRPEIEAVRKQAIQHPYAHTFLSPFAVELDAAVTAAPGDRAELLDGTATVLIRNNRVRNAGSRGIVADHSSCRVENNRISHSFLPGIHVFAFFRSEGGPGFCDDVRICGNQVDEACVGWPGRDGWLGGISVVSWDEGTRPGVGHRQVLIADNTLSRTWGVDIQVQCASDVTIRGNRLRQSHLSEARNGSPRPVDNRACIFLQDVHGARVEGNEIVDPGPGAGKEALVCVGVTDLQAPRPFVSSGSR
jgi:hypothetical protein